MSWLDEALADYGRSLGFPRLAFDDRGVVNLMFQRSGALYFERIDDGLLAYLCREMDRPSAAVYAAALGLCHWRHNHPRAVNPALRRDRVLVFAARLREDEVSVPVLEQTIGLLQRLHDQIASGAAP